MTRINVYARGEDAMRLEHEGHSTLLGHFQLEKCTVNITEDTYWDGNNHRGVISGLQCGHESLMRTAKGRWVRYYDSHREFNGPEFYEFLTDAQAKEWLVKNNDDESEEALSKYFGELEEEAGPIMTKEFDRLRAERDALDDRIRVALGILAAWNGPLEAAQVHAELTAALTGSAG